ncbi:large subunit ribosomal protein L16 [Mytilus galloprovincialis]|uniref:Large ribosomal subunit protein uL16m n=2 Tax=Mytilus galloprovincialis TaxID=29158 RepID=A0A8B6FBJ4_MYTGA|nr:large subunit ribosomal protein L16 [Mytilus galloprovincialis]
MNCLVKNLCRKHLLLLTKWSEVTQVATYMKLKMPEKEEDLELPVNRLRSKLSQFDKVPQNPIPSAKPPTMSKMLDHMRGPEMVNNKLIYGQFGIQALQGGRLRFEHYNLIRFAINKHIQEGKTYGVWRVNQPWQAVSKKGAGKQMGQGKSDIDHYVYPLKAGHIIFEIGGRIELLDLEKTLKVVSQKMPFKARIVTPQILEDDVRQEAILKEKNINPFTYEYCLKNNYNGVKIYYSPYDLYYLNKEK